jgi:hypothetical protein
MLSLVQVAQEGAPWWKLMLSDIPHDAGAVVVYLLIGAFVYFIWQGNRKRD